MLKYLIFIGVSIISFFIIRKISKKSTDLQYNNENEKIDFLSNNLKKKNKLLLEHLSKYNSFYEMNEDDKYKFYQLIINSLEVRVLYLEKIYNTIYNFNLLKVQMYELEKNIRVNKKCLNYYKNDNYDFTSLISYINKINIEDFKEINIVNNYCFTYITTSYNENEGRYTEIKYYKIKMLNINDIDEIFNNIKRYKTLELNNYRQEISKKEYKNSLNLLNINVLYDII